MSALGILLNFLGIACMGAVAYWMIARPHWGDHALMFVILAFFLGLISLDFAKNFRVVAEKTRSIK